MNNEYSLPKEIRSQVDALRGVLTDQHRDIVERVADKIRADIDSLFLVGAGDSLFAGLCAQYYMARWAEKLPNAVDVMEFSRYFYRAAKPDSAVFAISYSGETVRTLEASIAAKSQGATLVAMTRDPHSSMANLADFIIPNEADLEDSNARTGSFQSMHLSLLLLALALMSHDDEGMVASAVLKRVSDIVEQLPEYIAHVQNEIADTVQALSSTRQFYFLGAGIGWPIARYGYSKLYETASVPSIASELEQFAHGEIFSLDPPDTVVIVAQTGPSFERAIEVARAVRKIGSTVWGLSDNVSFAEETDQFTLWPAATYEELSVIPAIIPLQWFAYYWALQNDSNPDRVRHKAVNSPLIRECSYWSLGEYESRN